MEIHQTKQRGSFQHHLGGCKQHGKQQIAFFVDTDVFCTGSRGCCGWCLLTSQSFGICMVFWHHGRSKHTCCLSFAGYIFSHEIERIRYVPFPEYFSSTMDEQTNLSLTHFQDILITMDFILKKYEEIWSSSHFHGHFLPFKCHNHDLSLFRWGQSAQDKIWIHGGLGLGTDYYNDMCLDEHSLNDKSCNKFPRLVIWNIKITLWLFNIAMTNGPFIDGLPIENGDFPWLC